LGRHGRESRSGVLKLQMPVRRHSVLLPFDRPCVELYDSAASCEAPAAKASGALLPVAYTLQRKKSTGKTFYPHSHAVLFFLKGRF